MNKLVRWQERWRTEWRKLVSSTSISVGGGGGGAIAWTVGPSEVGGLDTISADDALLLETGDYLLLENGDYLLLEY